MTRAHRILAGVGALATVALGALALAQIEGRDRGVPPVDSSANYEVGGVEVDVAAGSADEARSFGWRLAQRRGWRMLWARLHGTTPDAAPALPDGTLDGIVSGIAVEEEEVGTRRYIARLGVLFDRARAAEYLGVHGEGPRSPPMLVIPVMWSGGAPQSFEKRTEWQRAWARFRSGNSAINYVRPTGAGLDPLLLNVAQAGRPARARWRRLFDQYGATDVLVPIVEVVRRWPGGPVLLHFRALHGIGGEEVARFDLFAPDAGALGRMLDEGVRRMDVAYTDALRAGGLIADPTIDEPSAPVEAMPETPANEADTGVVTLPLVADAPPATPAPVQSFGLQAETPDAAAQAQIEAALRQVPGIAAVETTSLALGGVSVMRVGYAGDLAGLRAALVSRGLAVQEVGGQLRIGLAGR